MAVALTTQTLVAQVPSYVPTNGLVGYWPFSGNANDISGNGNNGTNNGAALTTDRFGNSNSAYDFDGISSFIYGTGVNLPEGDAARTVSLWVKTSGGFSTNTGGNTGVVFNYGTLSFTQRFGVLIDDNTLNNYLCSESNDYPTFNPVNTNTWTNIVWVYSNTNLFLYINGILTTTGTILNINTTGQNFVFGNTIPNSIGQFEKYKGAIDDIGIWNRALTQEEITAMYNGVNYSDTCNAVSGSLTQGLVGYWPFCGNANDDSGNGNNGTVSGATLTTDRFGNSNSAYDFDGLTSFISGTGVNLPEGDAARTVSLWVKTTGGFSVNTGGQTGSVFDYGTLENNKRFGVLLVDNDFTNYFSAVYNDFHPNTSVVSNVWTNIVWVYSDTNLKLYINGILSSTGNVSNLNTTGQNFVIGNTIPNSIGQYEKYKGAIDDISIWNRALTQLEITQLYNQNQCFTNTTVTDILIINVGQLSYTNPIAYANNIIIAPNPASTQINISFNNITNLNGGTLKVINSLGQEVATTPITTSGTNSTMQLATWGGTGMYFVQIINPQGQIVDIKKIILQ